MVLSQTKDRVVLTKSTLIAHDPEYIQEKFFSEEDMLSVPQNPFKYPRETLKDTAFRESQSLFSFCYFTTQSFVVLDKKSRSYNHFSILISCYTVKPK